MIKVMIETYVKVKRNISLSLLELGIAASAHSRGFVSGEALLDTRDDSKIITLSTWKSIEDWEQWAKSEFRAKLYQDTETFLRKKPTVRIFEVVATEPGSQ